MKRIYKLLIAIFILVSIDQMVKLIIHYNYMDTRLDILFPMISFEPYLNSKYSWINSMGG